MKKILPLVIVLFTLFGCSADWHIKRAIKKDPKITRDARVITHYDTITVITEGAKADTIFKYKDAPKDTFVLETTRFKTQVIKDTVYETIEIETECYPDTVERIIEVPVTIYDIELKDLKWYERIWVRFGKIAFIIIAIILLLIALRYSARKFFRGPLG